MADNVKLINGIGENFRDNQDRKFKNSQRETLERFVNGQDVFVMYESWSSEITLDNKVNKESDQAKHSEH